MKLKKNPPECLTVHLQCVFNLCYLKWIAALTQWKFALYADFQTMKENRALRTKWAGSAQSTQTPLLITAHI